MERKSSIIRFPLNRDFSLEPKIEQSVSSSRYDIDSCHRCKSPRLSDHDLNQWRAPCSHRYKFVLISEWVSWFLREPEDYKEDFSNKKISQSFKSNCTTLYRGKASWNVFLSSFFVIVDSKRGHLLCYAWGRNFIHLSESKELLNVHRLYRLWRIRVWLC